MAKEKYKSALIKVYSNQFEIHTVDGKPVPSKQGIYTGTTKEILIGLGVWIEAYMNIRKKVPLIIEITEAGQIILSPGSTRDN